MGGSPRTTRRTRDLTSGSIPRALLALAGPIVAANLLQTVYQLIDTFWVGRLGPAAVAAVSVSFPILFVLIALGGGLAIAGAILVAQHYGAGDSRAVDHVSAQTLLSVGVVSVGLSAAGYLLTEPLMALFAPDATVAAMAGEYLRISFLGMVAVFIYFVVQSLMRGVGDVRTPLFIVTGTVLLNFVLDPLLILGWGPVAPMGVAGAALATILTQGLSAVVGVWVLTRGRYGIHLRLDDLRPDLPLIRKVLALGIPSSLEQSARGLGFAVMMILVTGFGTTVTAAYGIGVRVLGFVIIPALGLSMATTTVVGQNIGAGRPERAVRTAWIGVAVAFSAMTGAGLLLFAIAPAVIATFVPDAPEVLEIGTAFLRIIALFFGFIGVQQVLTGALRGAGATSAALVLTVVQLWVFLFPLAWLLSRRADLGPQGIWWAYPAANVLGATLAVGWFRSGSWQRPSLAGEAELEERVARESIVEEGLGG